MARSLANKCLFGLFGTGACRNTGTASRRRPRSGGPRRLKEERIILEKILIIDDSIVQASQLKAMLEDDYEVSVAQTAEEGQRWTL